MSTLGELTVGYICADINALASCSMSLDHKIHTTLSQARHDNNSYTFGKIGSHHIAICCLSCENEYETMLAAGNMIRSFHSIKLLILVSSNAGAAPRDVGQVRVGDVVVAQKFVKRNRDGDPVEVDLLQASGILATIGMDTPQRWSLDEDIANIGARSSRWGRNCIRPAGEDVDKLDKVFAPRRQDEPASMVHRHGLVVSNPTYPEHAESRDSVAGLGKFESASVVCFDQSQTAGLLIYMEDVDVVSVLGVSNYCDEDTERDRRRWTCYTSMAAAACARNIVMALATETKQDGMAKREERKDN